MLKRPWRQCGGELIWNTRAGIGTIRFHSCTQLVEASASIEVFIVVGVIAMNEPGPLVSIRHSAVPGRVRLSVFGLFRNPERGPEVEREVAKIEGVVGASANPLTGNALVLFNPSILNLANLVAAVETALRGRNGHAKTGAAKAAGERQRDKGLFPRAQLNGTSPRRVPRAAMPALELHQSDDIWHSTGAADVIKMLSADPRYGLHASEVEARVHRYGANLLPEPEEPSLLRLLADQFLNAPAALLAVGAALSFGTGALLDALLIGSVLVVNAAIGAATERTGRRAIAALRRSMPIPARVLRSGEARLAQAAELVPGDTVLLQTGDPVPADARLIEVQRLQVEESALTGEPHPVVKSVEAVDGGAALADRHSMVFRGTTVVGGHAKAVVVATGSDTVIGALRILAAGSAPPPTPMERDMDRIGRQLAVATTGIIVGVMGLGILRGVGLIPSLTSAIALGIAAVPEALPALATTVLSLSSGRMRKRGTLVRSLPAAEALGSVTVVCADKTGTLTENRMAVGEVRVNGQAINVTGGPLSSVGEFKVGHRRIDPEKDAALSELLRIGVLCSDAEVAEFRNGEFVIDGSPTEGALLVMAHKAGMDTDGLRTQFPRIDRRDRGDGRRRMITVHRGDDSLVALLKGAPEELLEACDRVFLDGVLVAMTPQRRVSLARRNSEMAAKAMRVLAFASKRLPDSYEEDDLLHGFTWCGLVGLKDPVRSAAPEAVRTLWKAGIRTVMITGDQPATAVAVAKELGLGNGEPLRVLEAADLASMDPGLLSSLVSQVDVFARVSPEAKLTIVRALQANGEIVAMTGDGVNDAPALRAADVGVAMGERGSELARELADVVLSTDDLSKMAEAIEEGRLVRANIRRSLHYLLGTNASEVWAVSAAVLVGLPSPLTAGQLLWINLVSDLFPVIGLAMEPRDPDLMDQPPCDPAEPVLPAKLQRRMLGESAVIGGGALLSYGIGLARYGAGPVAQTMAFWSLSTSQLMHVFLARAGSKPALRYERSIPLPLAVGLGISALLQLGAMFVPPLRAMLGCVPLGFGDALTSILTAGATFGAIEGQRLLSSAVPDRPQLEAPRITDREGHQDYPPGQ